jgi:polysaccharide export outer membrane protein
LHSSYSLYNECRVGASIYPMYIKRQVCWQQLGRWCDGLLFLCFYLLLAPVCFSQAPTNGGKTADNLEKFETAKETNDRIAQLVQTAAVEQGDYAIGSGDLLNIEVFDVPELSRDVRVNESGFVSLPLVPVKIHAGGLTSFQFQDKVAELLQTNGLVSNPQVTVTIKERHSEPITLIGAVKMPLVVQAVRQMTLLEVLSQAGGIADDAGSQIIITRAAHSEATDAPTANDLAAQPTTITIDLNNLLDSGDSRYNIPLMGGDVIRVPRAGVVYAVGAVQHPGGFVMQSDRQQMTVLKLVSLSGGLVSSAKPHNAVILRQNKDTGGREQVPVDVNKILTLKSEDVVLGQSDILFVPDSTSKKAWRRTGEIAITLATGVSLIRLAQ